MTLFELAIIWLVQRVLTRWVLPGFIDLQGGLLGVSYLVLQGMGGRDLCGVPGLLSQVSTCVVGAILQLPGVRNGHLHLELEPVLARLKSKCPFTMTRAKAGQRRNTSVLHK